MAFIPVPNVARVETVWEQGGQVIENVFHFSKESPFSADDLFDLLVAFGPAWASNISGTQDNSVIGRALKATALDTESSPAVELGSVLNGTLVGDALPQNSTVAIKWVTGFAGRSFRGRTYHVGLVLGYTDGLGHLNVPAPGLLSDAYNGFRTDMLAAGFQMVVVSYITGGAPRAEGLATPITSAVLADTNLDSQRRRLPGRGR